jgi:hypothetical protein
MQWVTEDDDIPVEVDIAWAWEQWRKAGCAEAR